LFIRSKLREIKPVEIKTVPEETGMMADTSQQHDFLLT